MKSEDDIWVSIRKVGLMFGIISLFLLLYLFTQFYELYKLYDYYHFDSPCVRIVVASVFHKNITGSGKLDISEALS